MFDKSSEEMNSNVFKITKEKLLSIANNATKKDTNSSRPPNNRGYHRLKSTWIPRSCQTMKDHPTQMNFSYWNREDMSLLKNWMADKPDNFVDQSQTNPEVDWTTDGTSNPEVNFANWSANDTNPEGNFANWTTNDINPEANFANWDDNEEEDEEEDDSTYDDFYSNINNRQIEEVDIQQVRTIENWLQGKPHSDSVYSLESSDNDDSFPQDDNNLPTNDTNNNGYKTDPVIVMNDDFIEIHFDSETALQQAQESFDKFDNKISRCIPRNRNNHHVEIQSSKIIKTNGLSPRHPPLYKNFLEKDDGGSSSDNAQSSDSCNSLDNQVIDDWEESVRQSCYNEHRQLRQYLPKVEDAQRASQGHQASQGHKTPNAFKRIGSCKIKSEDLSASFAESKRELKNFLSFRKPKKKNQCKNRVVVGEEGVAGPIWPAVLLTFDRGISPTPDSQPNQLSPSSC